MLLLAALVLSIQNAAIVDVNFFTWKFTASLALVAFATPAAGLIGGWAISSTLRLKAAPIRNNPVTSS